MDDFVILGDDGSVDEPGTHGLIPPDGEEDYVAMQLGVTRAQMDAGLYKDSVDDKDGSDRLMRAERYARWRWREFHAGRVASL